MPTEPERGLSPVKGGCPPGTNLQHSDVPYNNSLRMSPEEGPSSSPMAGEEGPGTPPQQGGVPNSNQTSAITVMLPATTSFNLTCMTCHTHFTSAEQYARHHCVSSATSSSASSLSSHMARESSNDVERFDGKIVYNPDGSAYIIDSEVSDEEGCVGLDLPRHEGSIVDSPRHPLSTTSVPSIPTIANAIYVTKNPAFYSTATPYGQPFTSLLQENKVPELPIVHNYRVFTVSDKDDDSDVMDTRESDKPKLPLLDYAQVPIKPILMCFVCKLSFGYVKSFIAHAMGDHSIVLLDEEKDLLAAKNTSAIIQCAGRDKDARVSFLEPVPPLGSRCGGISGSHRHLDGPMTGTSTVMSPRESLKEREEVAETEFSEDEVSIERVKKEVTDLFEIVRQHREFTQPMSVPSAEGNRKSPISASSAANGRTSVSPVTSLSPTNFSPLQSPMSQLTGTVIGACPEHMNGRPQGVNCDKCDMILQQTRQYGGQMAFMHSRNSCKTLKCPKCNWHYKYQETLEIHMKEKHPENESSCIYCLTNQPHPRLARGETYTCGYKPYRCEVCNYSTTTKGNLSIHMQSDKHLNNMQELQNGGMPSLDTSLTPPMMSVSQHSQPPQQSPSSLYAAPKTPTPVSTPTSGTPQQKPKPVWRCDVCNYETNVARNLRIHMTSEKHTHNMMVLQQNVKHMQQLSALQGGGGGHPGGQIDPLALLQYATNPAAAAMMASLGMGEKPPLPEAALADLAYNQALLIQMMSGGQMPGSHHMGSQSTHASGPPGPSAEHQGPHFDMGLNPESLEPPPEPVPPNPRHAFNCCVCSVFSTDSLEQLNHHLQFDRSKLNENEVLLVVAGNYICKLCSYKTNLKANFQLHCKTDKHLQKLQHVNHILEGGPRNEWKLKYLSNTNPLQVRCNLCEYYTNSVHKLQLHAAHQRHEVVSMLFRHLQIAELSLPEERRQYSCALCSFCTRGKLHLLHHIRSMRHLQMEQLHQLQRHAEGRAGIHQDIGEIFRVEEAEDEGRDSPMEECKEEGRSPDQVHACPFCQFTCEGETTLQQHVDLEHGGEKKTQQGLSCPLCEETCSDMTTLEKHATVHHSVNAEGLQRLLLLVRLSAAARREVEEERAEQQQPKEEVPSSGKSGEERGNGRGQEECGVCGVQWETVEECIGHQTLMGHNTTFTQTPNEPTYSCWKKGCNEQYLSVPALRTHFSEVHGATAEVSIAVSEKHVYKYRCQQCSLAFKTVEKLKLHSQYHAIRDATKCLLCHRNFRSLAALQRHVSSDHSELTVTEKQQFQASIVKAPVVAGAGPVLNPNTTSLLRKESSQEIEYEEQYEDLTVPPQQRVFEDYLNSESMALDNYSDPTRKYKCHRCRVAFTRSSYMIGHQKTLLHRRGEKITYPMEKFLDPNRPFKCEVCKESFTQKNILLVHYNSVSHLHKLKKIMHEKENSAGTLLFNQTQSDVTNELHVSSQVPVSQAIAVSISSDDEDHSKPYKCNLCKVSYSQQSTLDIHLRSVLHQTRASRLPDAMISADKMYNSKDTIHLTTVAQYSDTIKNSAVPHARRLSSTPQKTGQRAQPETQEPSHSGGAQGSCSRCGSVWNTVEQGAQHAVLCGLLSSNFALFPHALSATSGVPPPSLDAAWAAICNTAYLLPAQPQDRSLSPSECSIESISASRLTVPIVKTPHLHKHLLESYGFDIAAHYVENEQNKSNKWGIIANHDISELNSCDCVICSKHFSNIWVLKSHLEEIHNLIVPFDNVQKFANEYRKLYYSRHNISRVPSALPDSEDRGREVEGREGGEKRSTTDEREKEAESCGRSDATTTPTPLATPTPGVTPTPSAAASSSPADQPGMSMPQMAEMAAALNALTAAQMQQMHLHPMMMAGLGLAAGLPMHLNPLAAMNLHPPLMPMMSHHMFDHSALAGMGNHPGGSPETSNMFKHQQIMQQQQQQHQQQQAAAVAAAAAAAQQKRARTRITDDQLKILRAHFDINNSPTEEQINEMAKHSGLPPKVIKHWFRNTLFKERQRSKDSPYNFSIPPSTTLNLEEYEKTGETKTTPVIPDEVLEIVSLNKIKEEEKVDDIGCAPKEQDSYDMYDTYSPVHKTPMERLHCLEKNADLSDNLNAGYGSQMHHLAQPLPQMCGGSQHVSSASSSPVGMPSIPFNSMASSQASFSLSALISSQMENNQLLAHKLPHNSSTVPSSGLIHPNLCMSPPSPHMAYPPNSLTPTTSSSPAASGKRANRTRFTDYQIKVLQEFFENNAYPKDDDLEYLSKLLNLSPRVIVVWFQNARQKARKVYENQPPIDPAEENAGRFTRTPGLNYQCKKCLLVFQRYYELIRHQKTHCFKEEDAKRSAQAQAAAAQAAALYTPDDNNSNHSSITESSQQSICLETKLSEGCFQCDKCSLTFNRFEQWREHQIVHLMNPTLFLNKGAESPFSMQTQQQQISPQTHIPPPLQSPLIAPMSPMKRKAEDSDDERGDLTLTPGDLQRDKRLRTTILPEQLDYLYQKYQMEANPSRKMLETIAQEVGLKKRVVQVWFQNTRARERKGQFRAHAQVINKKCPFCPAIFKVKSALESHLSTKHAELYAKGEINIDALPDVEDSGVGNFGLSSSASQASSMMSPSLFSSSDVAEDSIAWYHEEAIRRYLSDVNLAPDHIHKEGESPLDLSKPLELVRPLCFDSSFADTSDDHIEYHSDDDTYQIEYAEHDDMDGGMNSHDSNPTSPTSSINGSAKPSHQNKRFRTQMSGLQVKLMKTVFMEYKTPTMAECELLGREIGLAKRVIQVWFQNARAKEKKAKLAIQKMFGTEPDPPKPPEECKVCSFVYSHKYSIQDHIFTRSHIENMRMYLEKAKDENEAGLNSNIPIVSDNDRTPTSLPPSSAGLAHQLHMAQLMALSSPVNLMNEEQKRSSGSAPGADELSRLQFLQQMYQQMGLGGLQGAPHPLLQHAMMAGAGE